MAHAILPLLLIFLSCIFANKLDDESNLKKIIKSMKIEMKNQKIQMEEIMSKMEEDRKNKESRMENRISEVKDDALILQRKVEMLEAEIQQCRLNNTHENSKRLLVDSGPIARSPGVHHIAFSARLTHGLNGLADHQTIEFDREICDFGNVYDPTDGIFTAPVSGVYVFSWTIATEDDRNQLTALVRNGVEVDFSYADSSDNDGTQASNTVVTQVNAGEHVMIKTSPWAYNSHVVEYARANTFSGWLLWSF